jgi:DNA-binding transcriptional LysR family regulator
LAASHKLGLSHATIARKLTNLEKELGVLLLNRRPTGSTLTSAGPRLLKIAERMEAEVLQTSMQVSTDASSIPETIMVGVPDGFGNYFLARELSALMHFLNIVDAQHQSQPFYSRPAMRMLLYKQVGLFLM